MYKHEKENNRTRRENKTQPLEVQVPWCGGEAGEVLVEVAQVSTHLSNQRQLHDGAQRP